MKTIYLILITFIISGCNSDNVTEEKDNNSSVVQQAKIKNENNTSILNNENNSSNLKIQNENNTTTRIIVERGAVFESTVKDSSGNIAIQEKNENVYVFSKVPIYPITATGGWIDLDGDKNKSSNDIDLDIELSSYRATCKFTKKLII